MICKVCGHDIPDGFYVCPKCGYQYSQASQDLHNAMNTLHQLDQADLEDKTVCLDDEQQKTVAINNPDYQVPDYNYHNPQPAGGYMAPPVPQDGKQKGKMPLWLKIMIPITAVLVVAAVVLALNASGAFNGNLFEWQTIIPDVVKSDYNKADTDLNKAYLHGLIVDKVENPEINENCVVSQDPGAKQVANKGFIVDLVLSAGSEEVYYGDMSYCSKDYVEKTLKDKGLNVKIVSSTATDNKYIAPDSVSWLQPDPNTPVKKGETVTIRVQTATDETADATKEVSVPDMTGKDFFEMARTLFNQHIYLEISSKQFGQESDKNKILSQDIASGTKVKEGTVIKVVVCDGEEKVFVPDVVYRTEASAKELLEGEGYKVEVQYEESKTVAKGTVIKQSTEEGTQVKKGSDIVIVVSSGYSVAVPDVVGDEEKAAINKIYNSMLSVVVVYEKSDSVKKGTVISQDYNAGEKVQIGTTVVLTVCGDKRSGVIPEKRSDVETTTIQQAVSSLAETTAPTTTAPITTTTATTKSTTTTKKTTQSSGTGWKKAYGDYARKKLQEASSSMGAYFNLIYLNDDSIPELVVCTSTAHIGQVDLVAYKNSGASFIGKYGEFGGFLYVEKTGFFISGFMQHGYSSETEYKFDGSNAIKLRTFTSDAGAVGDDAATYTIDDKAVSQSEYERAHQITRNGRGTADNSYPLTSANISKYLA